MTVFCGWINSSGLESPHEVLKGMLGDVAAEPLYVTPESALVADPEERARRGMTRRSAKRPRWVMRERSMGGAAKLMATSFQCPDHLWPGRVRDLMLAAPG